MAASAVNRTAQPDGSSGSTDSAHALTIVDATVLTAMLDARGTPPGPEQVWNGLLGASGGQAPA